MFTSYYEMQYKFYFRFNRSKIMSIPGKEIQEKD